jgi:acetyl esterase/lipase
MMRLSRLVCRLFLTGACLCCTAIAAKLPVSDFVKHPTLTNPVLSPDGKYLAVAVNENTASADADYQLAVLQLPDLKPVSRLNMAPRFVPMDIHWVSDKRLIMALATEEGSLEKPSTTSTIIAVDYDGTHKHVLYSDERGLREQVLGTNLTGNNFNLSEIPIGIASIAGVPTEPNGHFYLDLQMFSANSNFTDWDTAESRMYDVETLSGHADLIGDISHGGLQFLAHDGIARIAYGQNGRNQDVAFTSSDGRNWTPINESAVGAHFEPLKISADGEHLYALSSLDGGPNALIECNLDGTSRKVLASDSFSSVDDVMWNPNTHAPIAAVFDATGRPEIHWIGSGIYVEILQALAKTDPSDFVSLSGASTDGSMLLIYVHSDRNPGAYALFDKATMHAQPLYRVLPWITPGRMPQRMPIRFTSRDGMQLGGFLTLPEGNDHQNLPLVVIPHGGPIGIADNWFYDPWAALLANRGFATLQINYRGSGGRGYNFQRAGYRQFGSGIQDDLIDGVKWAIAQGYVDPNRICVFGGSFGGYSALMQPIFAPGLYKCAIDYAGVYDWRIGMDRSDTRHYQGGRTYFRDAIGNREDAYTNSPASMMDKFNVPVLIAHGKDDPRVPYQNATDLRAALEKAVKPYEWLAESKEQHGFYSEPHNEELWNAIIPFLDKYIGSNDMPSSSPP